MKRVSVQKFLTLSIAIVLLHMATGCRRSLPTAADSAIAQAEQPAAEQPLYEDQFPMDQGAPQQNFAPPAPMQNFSAPRNEPPNQIVDTLKVDQDFFHQWHAVGVIGMNGKTYVAASDKGGIKKMGTVIEMSGAGGKRWKDYGSKFLATIHPMKASISGITQIGNRLLTIDLEGNLFSIENGKIRKQAASPGKDIAAGGNNIYIATLGGTVEKIGSQLAGGTPVPQVRVTGGIGADKLGNLFAVADLGIAKVGHMGQPQLIIPRAQLKEPIDVAVDNRNGDIYVLDGAFVKRFDSNGQQLSVMGSSTSKPNSISVDETGKVYVTDYGNNFRDSKVVVFAASKLSAPTQVQAQSYGAPAPQYGAPQQGYAAPQYGAPAPQYGAPQGYAQPQARTYAAPQGYAPQAQAYGAPQQQYGSYNAGGGNPFSNPYGAAPQQQSYGQQGYGQQPQYGYQQNNRRQY